jgi:hypothetical protein
MTNAKSSRRLDHPRGVNVQIETPFQGPIAQCNGDSAVANRPMTETDGNGPFNVEIVQCPNLAQR